MRTQAELEIQWQLVDNQDAYRAALQQLAATHGPIAIDTERASGYRYFPNAYLVQIRRGHGPIYLFDPTALKDLSELGAIINSEMWILHSGRHDLPCLADLELVPQQLWDTELAARMLRAERVGLGALVADQLQVQLDKAYSDVDWSERPLQPSWLEYAAVDVLFLADLMVLQLLEAEKTAKLSILRQEFAALCAWQPKPPAEQPWRKVSHINVLAKDNRGLALVREIWTTRDEIARNADLAPHLVLPDSAIITAAQRRPRSEKDLQRIKGFNAVLAQPHLGAFWRAVMRGKRVDENLRRTPLPAGANSHGYFRKNSGAKARLETVRETVAAVAATLDIPAEHVLDPAVVKRLAADPPALLLPGETAAKLDSYGARQWQIAAVSEQLAAALAQQAEHGS